MEKVTVDNRKSALDISVRNPVTHNTWDKGRYTSYEIAVNTSNKSFCLSSSSTRRRYSEFEWLLKTLKNHHPLVSPPDLPPKKFFADRFDPSFIAFRMKGLEDFLNNLLIEKVFLSDTTMHLFLQTNLTIKEIKDYIEGRITATSLDSLWKANGIKENCREFNTLSTEEKGDWAMVKKDDTPKTDTLNVPTFPRDFQDSNNSDISSSYSDDDNKRQCPHPHGGSNVSHDQDYSVSSDQSKLSSHKNSKGPSSKEDEFLHSSNESDPDIRHLSNRILCKEVELDASSITDVELDHASNFVVSNEFSINTTD